MSQNIVAKKSLGQHWLTDIAALQAIVDLADISKEDFIVEIGPGKGDLTKLLTEKAKQVQAIELDSQLSSYLRAMNIANLNVVNQDVLEFNFDELPKYKLVANIPYYLTGKIIRLISELPNRPTLMVLLVQKEIAHKLTAEPGDLSILGLTAQYFWQIESCLVITKDKFDPPPKVDSQIVKLTPKSLSLSNIQQQALFRLIKIGFASKRKTLLNNLAAGLHADKETINQTLTSINIKPDRRPQTLNLEEWVKLSKVFK